MVRRRRWGLAGVALAAATCTFSPQELSPGDDRVDASIPIDGDEIDADEIDAMSMIDAVVPDGPPVIIDAALPDAPQDQCEGGSSPLTLSTTMTHFAAPSGASVYDPICADKNTAETMFHADLAPVGTMDFVVDVSDAPGTWDSVVDYSLDCKVGIAAGTCSDSSNNGHGEAVVITSVTAGRRYVIVDTFGEFGVPNEYDLRAFLRPVRGVASANRACDPALVTSRCDAASYCVDTNNDGTSQCETLTAIADNNDNDTCGKAQVVTTDGAYAGESPDGNDLDRLRLMPAASPFNARLTLYTQGGACAADFSFAVSTGPSCGNLTALTSDDDSGLGACPTLTLNNVNAAQVILTITRTFYSMNPSTPYTVVIDYF